MSHKLARWAVTMLLCLAIYSMFRCSANSGCRSIQSLTTLTIGLALLDYLLCLIRKL